MALAMSVLPKINDRTYDSSILQQQTNQFLTVSSTDVIRLILVHLTECGLHESCRVLRQESGVGIAASLHVPQFWQQTCANGDWGAILDALSLLDKEKLLYHTRYDTANNEHDLNWAIASVHEMAILELAEAGEWELAYATYRLVQNDLSEVMIADDFLDDKADEQNLDKNSKDKKSNKKEASFASERTKANSISIARSLEQKLAALADQRVKDPSCQVSKNYYYNTTKQKRRQLIGTVLEEMIPRQPKNRLVSLLQQAIKWQMYTGQMPRIKRIFDEDQEDAKEIEEDAIKVAAPKKRTKRRRTVKEFDFVMGEVSVDSANVGSSGDGLLYWMENSAAVEKQVLDLEKWSTIKFGKKATPETAIFLPDHTASLVTGSSDGLIEIWDSSQKYTSLRVDDLPYQKNEELLGHNDGEAITALAITNDCQLLASGDTKGHVNIWRFNNGKCLRSISAHDEKSGSILCLTFSPDGSRILTASHDSTCREFGLRTAHMLKEFQGHNAYVTFCSYSFLTNTNNVRNDSLGSNSPLVVITGSGDGSVRIWDGKTADLLRVIRPVSLGVQAVLTKAGHSALLADSHHFIHAAESCPAVHSVLLLHTPPSAMVIVPRGQRAFLVNYEGYVLQTFQDDGDKESQTFVAATLSANNRWLYIVKEDGCCCIFDVTKGELIKTIRDFGETSTTQSSLTANDGSKITMRAPEISMMIHHPIKNIIGAFSNAKGQKKGQLVLWK